jgi:hypothetical protein
VKKFAESGDIFGAAGGIGLALGGWSVAIGAAVSVAKELAPIMDAILWGSQANVEAATAYAKEIRSTFELSQKFGRAERVSAMASGTFKPPDWIEEFVKNGAEFDPNNNTATMRERIRDEIKRISGDKMRLGNKQDYVTAAMQEKYGTSRPFANARENMAAEYEFAQQYDKMTEHLAGQIKSLDDALKNLRAELIRLPITMAMGGALGAQTAARFGNFAGNAEQAGGMGGFLDRYFKAQQEMVKSNPFASFQKENERINKDLADGVINEQQANIQRGRARQGLDSALPVNQPQFASLIKANSAEASKAILSAMLPKIKPEDRPLKDLKDEAEKQTKLLEKIGENTAKQLQPAGFN